MIKSFAGLLACVACVLGLAAWGGEVHRLVVTKDRPFFSLSLDTNSGTGYRWLLSEDYDARFVQPLNYVYNPANSLSSVHSVGMPGTTTFNFELKPAAFTSKRKIVLHFQYIRPWDSTAVARNVEYIIQVGP